MDNRNGVPQELWSAIVTKWRRVVDMEIRNYLIYHTINSNLLIFSVVDSNNSIITRPCLIKYLRIWIFLHGSGDTVSKLYRGIRYYFSKHFSILHIGILTAKNLLDAIMIEACTVYVIDSIYRFILIFPSRRSTGCKLHCGFTTVHSLQDLYYVSP